MVTSVRCARCGREVPRPSSPDPRCPACQAPLDSPPGEAASRKAGSGPTGPGRWSQTEIPASQFPVPAGGYEELDLDPEPEAPRPPPTPPAPSRPSLAAASSSVAVRDLGESSLGTAASPRPRVIASTSARGGLPVLPIAAGVVLILAIAAFALLRGHPAPQSGAGLPASELRVKTIGRPPEPTTPAVVDPPEPIVTMDIPSDRPPTAREPRRAADREPPARPARPAAREVARNDRPATITHAAPAPAPVPAPRLEPDPPLPPPPLVVAVPPPAPLASAAPLAVGPTPARAGYQKPRLSTPGCLAASLQQRREFEDFVGEAASVRFAVDESGKVSQFSYLSGPTDPRLASAIWTSIQRCDWTPGANAEGRPVTIWVTMPISFGR